MVDTLHNRIIERACRNDGWQQGPWKNAFLAKCKENELWAAEIAIDKEDIFSEFHRNPDAWRLVVEGPETPDADWNYPVLVLEFLEVEISHPMSLEKREDYIGLWWRFDGTSCFHIRIYRADRYGPLVKWLDADTIHHEMV